ncbi:MAG: MFS transporter [Acidimicrobiia bacterium]|nr:MFS transporter [Acidimicrobiia bacterium]
MKGDPTRDRRWLSLTILGFGVALVVVDITVVNVVMPSIIGGLDLAIADAEWINTAYPLVFAALLIPLGRLGDRVGSKRIFVAGLAVFGVASLFVGSSASVATLVAFRGLQGVGAAMILPATLSTVHAAFSGRDRAIAFGIWGSVIAGMAAVGPLVGGWITTEMSWRWAFYINVPLSLLTIAAALRWVIDRRLRVVETGIDLPGLASVSMGMISLTLALIEGPRHGWLSPTRELRLGNLVWPLERLSIVPLAALVAVVCLAAFVRIERSRRLAGRVVLVDLELFRIDSFRRGNILAVIVGLGEFGLVFVLPLFVRIVLGYSAFQTGILLLAMAAGGFLGGPIAAEIGRRFGPHRAVVMGMALEATGVLGVVTMLSPTVTGGRFAIPLFIYGLGVGMASAQLASIIMVDIPPEQAGQASGVQSTARQLGAALGIAILGTVYAASLGSLTESGLTQITALDTAAREHIVVRVADSAGWYVEALRYWHPDYAPVVAEIDQAIAGAAARAAITALAFFVAGVAQALRLSGGPRPGRRSPQINEGMIPAAAVRGSST